MKKFSLICLSLCMLFAMIGTSNYYVSADEKKDFALSSETIDPKTINYKFSEEQLTGTEYEGKKVEIINGSLFVDDRAVYATIVYYLYKGAWVVAGWVASGKFQKASDLYDLTSTAIDGLLMIWGKYQDMAEMYLNNAQKVQSFKLRNGNECVLNPSGTTYACKFSV
nr:unnamed protein product [uncultured bacterium]